MKLTSILTLFVALLITQANAQVASPDKIETNKGPVTIQPITHGSLILTWNNKTIYVDPYGGAEAYKGMAKPDYILITDIHGDHMDTATLAKVISPNAKIIAPQAVADKLPVQYKNKVTVMKNGDKNKIANIAIEAMPMYNLPETEDSKHVKGRGNGYLLTMGDKNVYISGDTEDIPEMRALKNIDVAFVSMNLPYTMDINQAADGVLAFKPKVIYPYHYRGQDGLSDVESFKKMVNDKNKDIEVRLRNWYPKQ